MAGNTLGAALGGGVVCRVRAGQRELGEGRGPGTDCARGRRLHCTGQGDLPAIAPPPEGGAGKL